MTEATELGPGRWIGGALPPNVRIGANSLIIGDHAFRRFRGRREMALQIGAQCTMDGVQFAVGEEGQIEIGDYCYFTNVVLLCEVALRIGSYVVIGWNAVITDADFHPIDPAERIADAIACSPLGSQRTRPKVSASSVVIGDDVWIGPNATILKGVRVGAGAWIEAGAMVTRDVPPRTRVIGNPAIIAGEL